MVYYGFYLSRFCLCVSFFGVAEMSLLLLGSRNLSLKIYTTTKQSLFLASTVFSVKHIYSDKRGALK